MNGEVRTEWVGQLLSRSVEETLRIGRRLGGALEGGDVLGLIGPLGAGKTHLAKGLAVGLGVADDRSVCSPTFVLVNEYAGRVRVFHVDAYRLSGEEELGGLGFEEMCEGGAVVVVEWADRVARALPRRTLWIDLAIRAEQERELSLWTQSASVATRFLSLGLDRRTRPGDKDESGDRRHDGAGGWTQG